MWIWNFDLFEPSLAKEETVRKTRENEVLKAKASLTLGSDLSGSLLSANSGDPALDPAKHPGLVSWMESQLHTFPNKNELDLPSTVSVSFSSP